MAKVMKSEEIFRRVREVVARALYVDKADIAWESRLGADLAAEWLDLLDLAFRLQQEFKTDTILAKHLFPKMTNEMTDAGGRLTETGIELLYESLPGESLAHLGLEPGARMEDLQTVGMLCRYMRSRFPERDDPALADEYRVFGGEG